MTDYNHQKQRMKLWRDVYVAAFSLKTVGDYSEFADRAIAEFDKRFAMPSSATPPVSDPRIGEGEGFGVHLG